MLLLAYFSYRTLRESAANIPLTDLFLFEALSCNQIQFPHFLFLEKDTDQFNLLVEVFVCL